MKKRLKYMVCAGLLGGTLFLPGMAEAYNPEGVLDSVVSSNGNKITVRGWAFDRDRLGERIRIHVYVGGPAGSGAEGHEIRADKYRPDVNRAYAGVGSYHGFDETIQVSRSGNQQVYVYAINVGSGTNVEIGSKSVNIKSGYNPEGVLDSVVSNAANQITLRGWAFDRDSLGDKLRIHVYVGGPAGSGAEGHEIRADKYRPDVNRAYTGVGNYHGFDATINVNRTGNQAVHVYGINVGSGTNVELGSKTVNIKANVARGLTGDLNGDGRVDTEDWTIYRKNFASYENNYNPLADFNNNGKVSLEDFTAMLNAVRRNVAASQMRGDVNGDKKVDAKDVELLMQYIKENDRGMIINEDNADVNGDGKINILDATALQQMVNPKKLSTNNPEGHVDSVVSNAPNQITVRGWAFDRDDVNKSLEVHVYVGNTRSDNGGERHDGIIANKYRTDVNSTYPGVGNNHGFEVTFNTNKTGNQPVYVYAINTGGGSDANLNGSPKTVSILGGSKIEDAMRYIASLEGRAMDYDNYAGAQCVDLIKYYYDYFGVAQYARGYGKDYAGNTLPPGWKRIQGAVPQKGDILVYTSGGGGHGHVAIAESPNVSWHQNFNGKYVRKISGNYKTIHVGYWGVIRPSV